MRPCLPSLCCPDVLERVVKPWLVAQTVVARQDWAVVIDLQLATPGGGVAVLIDVVNLV
mgnify:CR=1 FL=1